MGNEIGNSLILQKPNRQLYSSYMQFIEEMSNAGEKIWESTIPSAEESAEDFIARVLEAEVNPEPGLVPETTYWPTIANEVVGRIAFRHLLNENLQEFGGHIGYEVKPSQRRKGLATCMLKLLLDTPEVRVAGKVLLTCAPDNVGSNKTILANNGVLTGTKFVERVNRETNYYWIDVREQR